MSYLKSFLNSSPLSFLIYTFVSASAASFAPLVYALRTVLSDHFNHDKLFQLSYVLGVLFAALFAFFLCFGRLEKYSENVCYVSIVLLGPVYAFANYGLFLHKTTIAVYVLAIVLGGVLFGLITVTVLPSSYLVNPVFTTAYVLGIEVSKFLYVLVNHFVSEAADKNNAAEQTNYLFQLHSLPIFFAFVLSIVFILFVNSTPVLEAKKKNSNLENAQEPTSFVELLKDVRSTFVATGLISLSAFVESVFVPFLVPNHLKLAHNEDTSVVLLNSLFGALGALFSALVPLSPHSRSFKFVLWPLNLLRLLVLAFATQTKLFKVSALFVSSAAILSGFLNGYSLGTSFASLPLLAHKNKTRVFQFAGFLFLFFWTAGSAVALLVVHLVK